MVVWIFLAGTFLYGVLVGMTMTRWMVLGASAWPIEAVFTGLLIIGLGAPFALVAEILAMRDS